MNLLVTGGAGFIGSNFIRQRLSSPEGRRMLVVNLDKLTYAGNPANLREFRDDPRYQLVPGDIGDADLVSELLDRNQIDAVVNFAAESHVDRSIDSPEPFVLTNVLGTQRLLESTRLYWKELPAAHKAAFRFHHISTDEVYGTLGPADPPFSESTPYAPNSPYSASKAASDHFVRAYHHTYGLPVVATNCSNNYGPYHFPEKLIPLVILNALEEQPLPVYGDGQNVRDWLYVEDHCSAIWLVLQRGRLGETYNIGGLCEKTNLEVVRELCRVLDRRQPRRGGEAYEELITFVSDRPGHDRRYAIDCRKIREELGWQPEHRFEAGIEKTVDWYLTHLDWCREVTEKRYRRQRLGQI